jgi:hypothetical protein
MPPVPPIAPSPGASDDGSDSADEVELHRYPAVPTVPAVAPALLSAATPAGLAGRGPPAVGRPVRATRNAHPHYASAAVRVPAQGVGGTRGETVRLRVPEQRQASVHMAPSRQGSVTWHGLADSAKDKMRAARAQARRRTRREVTNAVKGREAAKARDKQEPAEQGATQCGSERTQIWQEVNRDIGDFTAAVATTGLHSHALPARTVAEALSRQDADRWQAAIDEELASCQTFGVWENCELPTGKQALPSRFVFERTRDGRYKARLVAGGHRQQHGLDFVDTFAPICSYRTMRMILAVSAHEDLVLWQFDVCTAFLNGELEEEVYVRPPPGAEHLAVGNKRVLRLRRALYGLKQASRAWNKRLEGELRVSDCSKGLSSQMPTRPCGFCTGRVARSLSCSMWMTAWWLQKLRRRRMLWWIWWDPCLRSGNWGSLRTFSASTHVGTAVQAPLPSARRTRRRRWQLNWVCQARSG